MSHLSKFLFFMINLITFVLSIKEENDYCQLCLDHTMCLYNIEKSSCNVISSGLSVEDKEHILYIHNKYRKKIASGSEKRGKPGPQPPAENMPDLVWDDELATIAQRWTNQCQYGHDKCRKVNRFDVGQNIAQHRTTGSSTVELEKLISRWYDEVDIFNFKEVPFVTNFKKVGHYTQMLWATTTKIGCGFIKYLKGNEKFIYLVCNYGPRGNLKNRKMYEPIFNKKKIRQWESNENFGSYKSIIEKQTPFSMKVNEEPLSEDIKNVVLHASKIFTPLIERLLNLENKRDSNLIKAIISEILAQQEE